MSEYNNKFISFLKDRYLGFFVDTIVMGFAYLFAILLRFEFSAPHWGWSGVALTFVVVAVAQWFFLWFFKCNKVIWRYITVSDVPRFFMAGFASAAVLIILRLLLPRSFSVRPPLSISLLNAIFVFGGLLLVRVFSRFLNDGVNGGAGIKSVASLRKVLLIGAGDAGNTVVREIRTNKLNRYKLVGLLDDDPVKQGANIQGYPVLGTIADLPEIVKSNEIDEIIVTMVVVPKEVIRRVVDLCKEMDVSLRILPAFHELINGSVNVSRLRNVEIADLLGREESKFDDSQIIEMVSGKCVLVTGAGGSIGSELARQVARMGPDKVILFERYENALFNIDREIHGKMPGVNVVPVVGDICDAARVEDVFQQYKPNLVIHAAAHKHVPMMEINPGEALKNNVMGTRIMGECAVKYNVDRFVLISTDKAVNPICIMGITKRMAEMVVQTLNQSQGTTQFSAVRFGNVLGSSGSVVPLFKEQISRGGPVTVTHPDMKRYFMTIEEAVHLVLLSVTQSSGGEIFVLDMGEPVRIVEMAEEMIRLSGLVPYEDIPITYTGVRPGEKLSEELDVSDASVLKTSLARIYLSKIAQADSTTIDEMLSACSRICGMTGDYVHLRDAVQDLYSRICFRLDDRLRKS